MTDEDAIIVAYDPFNAESRIYVCKNKRTEYIRSCSDIDTLANSIVAVAEENQIFNAFIQAPYDFISGFKQEVSQAEQKTYSQNKITIEGI